MPRQQGRAADGKGPAETGMDQRQDRRTRRQSRCPGNKAEQPKAKARRKMDTVRQEIDAAGNKRGRLTERQVSRREKQADRPENRPAGDDPVGDDPVGDDPAGDDPAGDDPAGDDPAVAVTKNREMRPGGCISPFYVIPERFERSTRSLEGCCSIQLSYGTIGARGPKAPFADAKVGKIFHFRVLSAVSWMKTCPFSPNYFAARNFLSTFAGLKARRG